MCQLVLLKKLDDDDDPFTWTHIQRRSHHSVACYEDALLKAMPAIPICQFVHILNFSAELLCKFCSSLSSDLSVGAIGLMIKRGSLPYQNTEMGDTDAEAVRAHWADMLFRWKIKNSQQISHMTDSCCWVWSMLWCQILWITHTQNKFRWKFL